MFGSGKCGSFEKRGDIQTGSDDLTMLGYEEIRLPPSFSRDERPSHTWPSQSSFLPISVLVLLLKTTSQL